ncbi:Ku protein [Streptomyces sp. AB3(2024)]|uniref:Ku protein n=1 Tax=Streptomyces sp. AB3(2024) TaxID=3317321 RepID=UPI0035A3A7E6
MKGYDARRKYVPVEPAEPADIAPGRSKALETSGFVDLDAIGPIFFDRTCHLGPKGKEYAKMYALLEQALGKADPGRRRHLRHARPGVLETDWDPEEFRDTRGEVRFGPRALGHKYASCAGVFAPVGARRSMNVHPESSGDRRVYRISVRQVPCFAAQHNDDRFRSSLIHL